MRRLSPALVVCVVLAALAVIVELATPESWSEWFAPLHLLATALVIAASLAGILGTSQLRSRWGTLPIAIATLGFATVVASAVATSFYGMQIRELLLDSDHGFAVDLLRPHADACRWWRFAGVLGVIGSIAGIGLVSRRIVPLAIVVALAGLAGALTSHVTTSTFTFGDAIVDPIWLHAAWLVGLAVVVWLAGGPAASLASDGFRRAGLGLWVRASTLGLGLGVVLGGTPTDGDAHAFFHAVTIALFVAKIAELGVAAWGLVMASRVDEPSVSRWLLAAAAGLLLVVAGAWLVVLPIVYNERIVGLDYYDNVLVVLQGLAFVVMMIGIAAVVRRHGLHEIRSGVGFRIGVVVVFLAIVVAMGAPPAGPSPGVIVRGILMVVVAAIAARECTNVAHRLARVPDMPTATLLQ
jgi:hypothetical protein